MWPLGAQVAWANEHGKEAVRIVNNANAYAARYLGREAQLCYFRVLLARYRKLFRPPRRPMHGSRKMDLDICAHNANRRAVLSWIDLRLRHL